MNTATERRGHDWPNLAGRDTELAVLARLIEGGRQGRSASLVVRGDAGVGKSALLEQAARIADGMPVVRTSGVESESELAFAGLSQLLAPLLGHLDSLPPPQAASLQAALALRPPMPSDPFTVSIATLGLLASAAGHLGLLACVDDAHSLDLASLRALIFAARRLTAEGVVILFAMRADTPTLLDQSQLQVLALEPLSDDAATEVLERAPHRLAPAVAAAIHETAAGNALALIEIPKLLTPEQAAGRRPLPDPLPSADGIQRLFQQRIALLSPQARRVLLLVAASDPETSEATAGWLDREGLEEAEAAELLEISNGVHFRHPLMRSAAYWAATDAERRSVHRALAEAMSDASPSLARAWHLALAAVGPDEEIAAELEAGAADAASRGAHGSAGRALERSARLTVDRELRAQRLIASAENLQLVGRFEEAFALLDEALTNTSETHLKGRASLARGRGLIWAGSPNEAAQSVLAEAASRLECEDRATSALLRAEAAHALMPAAYPRRCLTVAEEARTAAAETGGEPLVVATAAVAQALLLLGEARRSDAVFAEANVDAADPFTRAHFMVLRASYLAVLAKYDDSRAILEEVIGAGRQQSAPSLLPFPLAALAYVDYRTGRWTRAYAGASASVDLARETGQMSSLTFCLSALAQVEAATGRTLACQEHATEALQIARSIGADVTILYAGTAQLLSELGAGRLDEAITVGESVASLFHDRGYGEPGVAQWHGDLLEAYARAGRTSAARPLLARFEGLARKTAGVWALGVAARCRGLLTAEASFEDDFAQALQELERASAPFELARTELCLGERRRRARRRADARQPLRSALETFEALGAGPWAARARGELRACGGSPRQPLSLAIQDLTPHELQVALIVARGATNREAASELFLSPKTIDFHLRNIYRKLHIRSRSQLAAMLASW